MVLCKNIKPVGQNWNYAMKFKLRHNIT